MAENIGRYNVILNYEIEKEQLKQGTDAVKKEVSGMQKSFLKARNAFAGIVAVGGLQQLGSAIFEVTKKYQQYETILRVALGSQKESQKSMKLIQDTAKSTIFSVDELTSSYIKFVNRGIKPTQGEIIKIADLAASQGKSFEQLTEAILDAQTGEFERLKEFGIKASSEGNKVSLSFRGMNQTIEKTPEAINAAIVSMGALNGIAGSNKEQMSTLSGVISNLGDTFDQLFKAIGDTGAGVLGRLISGFSSLVGKITEFISPTVTAREETMKLQKEFNNEIEVLKRLSPENEDRKKIIQEINDKYGEYLPNLLTEKSSIEELTKIQKLANDEFKRKLLYLAFEEELNEKQKKLKENLKRLAGNETSKARSQVSNIELGNIGASPGQLKQQEEAYKNLFNAIEEGSKENIKQTEKEISELEKSYEKVAISLGTTLSELEKKFSKGEQSLSIATKNNVGSAAAKIKTELEKLNEEQKQLQDKLQNDLLKGLPADDKTVNRIKEINLTLEILKNKVDRIFDEEDVTGGVVQELTKIEKIKLREAAKEIESVMNALSQLNKAGVISDKTFDNLNIFEKAFDFEGGLTPEKQKEVTDKMKAALDESIAKARGEFNTGEGETGAKVPFFQQLFGFDDQQFAQFTNALKSAEQATLETLKTIFDQEQAINEQRIKAQDERVQAALKMAEKGKVEQLKIEEERLSELKKKQQSFANAQRAIASFQIATSSAVAVAEGIKAVSAAFASGGPAAIPLGIATSLALVAQVAGIVASIRGAFSGLQLKDGIEQVKGPGTRRSDSIPSMLSKDERVVDAQTNSKIGFGFKNKDLPKAVDFYKQHKDSPLMFANKPFYPQFQRVAFGQNKSNDKAISKRLDSIENTLKGMSVNVNIDSEGLAVEVMKKFEYYETRKRYTS
jgi:hypothetical protein